MNCTDFHRVVREYLEGQLPPRQQTDCEQHERDCASCADFMRTSRETCCRDLIEFLGAYVEDELPQGQRYVFERHLGVCPECVDYMDSFRQTIHLVRVEAESDCQSLPEELVQAILRARSVRD